MNETFKELISSFHLGLYARLPFSHFSCGSSVVVRDCRTPDECLVISDVEIKLEWFSGTIHSMRGYAASTWGRGLRVRGEATSIRLDNKLPPPSQKKNSFGRINGWVACPHCRTGHGASGYGGHDSKNAP